MKKVIIYKLKAEGTQEEIVTCTLEVDGTVKLSGQENFVKNLERSGIVDYEAPDGAMLFPKDGLRFLEQLKFNFKSGYLNATDVIES